MKHAHYFLGPLLALSNSVAAQEPAFVRSLADKRSYYVQEEIVISLRFGVETTLLETKLIQPFRQRLDLPVQVTAPWHEGDSDAPSSGLSFVLNGQRKIAPRWSDGRPYAAVQIETRLRPTEPGELLLSAATLRYAYADRYSEDLLGRRIPKGRHEATLSGNELRLEIMPLPSRGQPAQFSGAVGEFSLQAEVEPGPLTVGESFKLSLQLAGSGNFVAFEMPKLEDLEGFHLYGQLEVRREAGREVTYDLAPLSTEVNSLPAISFAYFDPREPASYRIVSTEPIPLSVRAAAEAETAPPRPTEETGLRRENDLFDIKPVPTGRNPVRTGSLPSTLLVLTLLAPWLLAAGYWSLRHIKARSRLRPLAQPVRFDSATFKQRIATEKIDPGEVLTGYLAARLRCEPAAIISPQLIAHLHTAGFPDEFASRCAAILDDLVAARFGGRASGHDAAAVCALIDRCEEVFAKGGESE